jgi:hypothetical protein
VAATFAKSAQHVYGADWVGYGDPVSSVFSQEDLGILSRHLVPLESMIVTALGLQESVWGAKLAGHFGLASALPLLRAHLLTPRRFYGWEGPDYSTLEAYLEDNQFPYGMAYLEAVEALTGKPLDLAVRLTQAELDQLESLAKNRDSEFCYWALWMQRKLKIQASP